MKKYMIPIFAISTSLCWNASAAFSAGFAVANPVQAACNDAINKGTIACSPSQDTTNAVTDSTAAITPGESSVLSSGTTVTAAASTASAALTSQISECTPAIAACDRACNPTGATSPQCDQLRTLKADLASKSASLDQVAGNAATNVTGSVSSSGDVQQANFSSLGYRCTNLATNNTIHVPHIDMGAGNWDADIVQLKGLSSNGYSCGGM